ncbi:DUF302 domain-containing protein [Psychromarinibacter sp. C21-152]|uniref:DUF302 domain-containing protein n=1 Tax=Psychromarinibacter sediminicola TaxID=3033385 RepID=A0AAE3T6Z3_9RHOB|nr:DUF302 domain-containing protein [Psychromarinibacter sediminicola]MDF0599782.1 DUF302 domain-containing protein [Psychromarinibacter sediminicola]
MRLIVAGLMVLALTGAARAAEIVRVAASGSVPEVANRLVVAVEDAGALVFARVDHAGGAATVGMELQPMELVVFGNPRLGTPAIREAPMAGLVLPLRVLVYTDGDGTWLAYQDPGEMIAEVGGAADAASVAPIRKALEKITATAAGG